jgi:5-methyltetrahydrofolate--homocysteine methyltransferase
MGSTIACLGENIDPAEIIDVAAGALKEVGDLFEGGELFLPEVMRAANAAKASLNIVLPLAANTGTRGRGSRGQVAIGSLGPHDIGKTIVTSMLIADGFDVLDIGTCITPTKVEEALEVGTSACVLALSVLLTSDIDKSAEIIRRSKLTRGSLKVMVGGAAMNDKVAKMIGADAYGVDANEAVKLVRKFMEASH